MKKIYIVVIIAIFVISAVFLMFVHREQIFNAFSRAYWDFQRGGVGDPGHLSVQTFAGCQPRTNMELISDQGMTNIWMEESIKYHFDAIDVDRYMLDYCPPSMPEEVKIYLDEYYKKIREYEKGKGYPSLNKEDEEKEKKTRIEKAIKVSEYQYKFLNREFTILKNEPKE